MGQKMPRLIIAVSIAVALAGLTPSIASAAPMEEVLIEMHPRQFCCPQMGTWTASGAITDAGTYVRTDVRSAPPDRPFGEPGPFFEMFDLISSDPISPGTLTIRDESRDTGTEVTGVWQIASGTGAYERASGHGRLAFSIAPDPGGGLVFTLLLSGVISKAD